MLLAQADRALWDARAAMLLLLMGRCTQDEAAMEVSAWLHGCMSAWAHELMAA